MRYYNYKDGRPKKPYKNYQEYLAKNYAVNRNGEFKCRPCDGRGKIIHPDEKPDVIEGYKLARRIPCQICDGTGIAISDDSYRRSYKERLAEWRKDKENWDRQSILRRSGLAKLTEEEIEALSISTTKEEDKLLSKQTSV